MFFRQQKLEEALLFTGMFQDALQSLFDWLETVEPGLSSETAIMGDTQTVYILMDNHKVYFVYCKCRLDNHWKFKDRGNPFCFGC